jgi:hypothetical protein
LDDLALFRLLTERFGINEWAYERAADRRAIVGAEVSW